MYKSVTVNGEAGIRATCLLHSVDLAGTPMVTFEVEAPRIILAEINTHSALAKSSASSRAIPFEKMLQQLNGEPVRFGAANKGMQDTGEEYCGLVGIRDYWHADDYVTGREAWSYAKINAVKVSDSLYRAGYAKQVYNRLTEPFQMIKTLISGTEWANFFWLRHHKDADPTFAELARCMYEALMASEPQKLLPGEWHLPYILTERNYGGEIEYWIDENTQLSEENALVVSAARCAAVSFRNVDYNVEKCREVYARLVGDDRKHASAFEHQAKHSFSYGNPGTIVCRHPELWEEGITHVDREDWYWSGRYRSWIQHRKLIEGECYNGSLESVRQSR